MKKLLLLTALAASLGVQAQEEKKTAPAVRFGIKLGVNAATTNDGFGSGNLFKDPNYKAGITAGGFANISLDRHFSLQPELLISSEGSLQDGVIGSGNNFVNVFKTNLLYLQVPVMLQYNTGGGFYVEAGPQVGFLLNSELENKFPGTGNPATIDLNDVTKGMAFGLGAGLGYNLRGGFGFGARYTAGLSNVYDGPANIELKGSNIFVGIHYRFGGR